MQKNFLYRPSCELCGSDKKIVLFFKEFIDPDVWNFLETYYDGTIKKEDLASATYELAKCSKCGFIWQAYILNEDMMKKLYSLWILPEKSLAKKREADKAFFAGYAREVQNISSFFSKKPFEIDVMDFGMGWGYWCLMAKAFGYKVRGFEIAKDRVEFVRENGIDVIENFSDITANKYDFINAEQVFEHVSSPLSMLKLLVSSLEDGGVVKISVPNGRGIGQKVSKPSWRVSKDSVQPLEHINCFTHQTLVKFGKLAGLELMKQPFLPDCAFSLKSCIKIFLKKFYSQYLGTSLYFRKV